MKYGDWEKTFDLRLVAKDGKQVLEQKSVKRVEGSLYQCHDFCYPMAKQEVQIFEKWDEIMLFQEGEDLAKLKAKK